MANYNTNEFKSGLKIMLDGDPYTIVENEFVKPGKIILAHVKIFARRSNISPLTVSSLPAKNKFASAAGVDPAIWAVGSVC